MPHLSKPKKQNTISPQTDNDEIIKAEQRKRLPFFPSWDFNPSVIFASFTVVRIQCFCTPKGLLSCHLKALHSEKGCSNKSINGSAFAHLSRFQYTIGINCPNQLNLVFVTNIKMLISGLQSKVIQLIHTLCLWCLHLI